MAVNMVLPVAEVNPNRYTGGMSEPRNPNEISASTAMGVLGVRSKPTFYNLIARVRAEYGIELQHYPYALAQRAYYLRDEIEAVKRGDFETLRQRQIAERRASYSTGSDDDTNTPPT